MLQPWAQMNIMRNYRIWACGLILLFGHSCRKNDIPASIDDGQSLEIEQDPAGLSIFSSNCNGTKSSDDLPILYAHFLGFTLKDDICFSDVVDNKDGVISCAPGPFLATQKNSLEGLEQWTFATMPDYLVWHLEDESLLDERFYITNQTGFPLRAQIIKLQKDTTATLVLFPKMDLTLDTPYYIYMTTETKDAKKTWIQPIRISASASDKP